MKSRKTTLTRKLSMIGFDLIDNGHNIFALLEFDITSVRKYLRGRRTEGEGGSLFAFFLKAIALCLKEYPLFNSMINYHRTTEFESVDISIPIEMSRNGDVENKQYLLKDAANKSLKEISDEIETAKNTVDEQRSFIVSRSVQTLFSILPRRIAVLLLRSVLKNHKRVMELSGSVFVTSVSMYSSVPGLIIPYIGGPKASSFAIGSAALKPVVIKKEIAIREMINITAVFNHDIIDGAPAARFINKLRTLIEIDYGSIG